MFQREFALRLIARPGDELYCRLSVNAQMFAKVTHIMKVSRNNFRPPPQVESSVVRIEPKNPRPQLDFEEWDGLLRVCFLRKNKTFHAAFTQTSVLTQLERNYRTWCSENEVEPNLGSSIKDRVCKILEKTELGETRARKCDETDFLKLLLAFNSEGFHFMSSK